MNRLEIINFLQGVGAKTLDVEDWEQGTPVLYVLHNDLRTNGPYRDMADCDKPSIARIDSPTYIHYDEYDDNESAMCNIGKEKGGQVDYYTINAATKEISLVKTSHNTDASAPYFAYKTGLYRAHDELFPKSDSSKG